MSVKVQVLVKTRAELYPIAWLKRNRNGLLSATTEPKISETGQPFILDRHAHYFNDGRLRYRVKIKWIGNKKPLKVSEATQQIFAGLKGVFPQPDRLLPPLRQACGVRPFSDDHFGPNPSHDFLNLFGSSLEYSFDTYQIQVPIDNFSSSGFSLYVLLVLPGCADNLLHNENDFWENFTQINGAPSSKKVAQGYIFNDDLPLIALYVVGEPGTLTPSRTWYPHQPHTP